ncbi:hypothetical protein B0E43_06750 [Algoriphagus sp. A40]|nr:hypothetical protein B0E43_06750 [Algoriphagus sp. A40]
MLQTAFSQEINAYKTTGSGDFPDLSIWVVWDGAIWNPATIKPNATHDIYIDQTHTLRLIGNESVKSVFINAETGAGQKLNLNGFDLEIYGSLNAFSGAAPGISSGTWNSQNWIGNSITSKLIFKGTSRIIIPLGAWSGFSTNSRYSVVFDPGSGQELTIEEPFKSLSFTIKSGTVIQKLDTSVIPGNCPTFSFNNETTVYGTGPFGEFVIESGATLISDCNSEILFRSSSISALNFDLQNGGTLILEGNAPRIEAANFQLNGKIIIRGGSVTKNFLTSSFADAVLPQSIRDLELQGPQNLNLPNQLFLLGNLEKSGTGNFITNTTSLTLMGSNDQEILGFPLNVRDLILNKPGGIFYPNTDLNIQRNLTLTQGTIDLKGNDLFINTGLTGSINYSGGSWKNVGLLTYYGLPATLNGTNSTFPFEDTRNGGIRKVQLLGNSNGGNLSIQFTEYKGAEYNSGFDDADGTDILYRLFSYFQFSGLSPSANDLEMRISADKLIVDNVDDLRIVGTGYAAPGSHLPGSDPVELWARRSLTFADLEDINFTVGSYRTLSILPVTWLEMSSKFTDKGTLVSWKVAQEKDNHLFEIYRSLTPMTEWEKVGLVNSDERSETINEYEFLDTSADRFKEYYYRIRQVDWDGRYSWSEVTKASKSTDSFAKGLVIYPNPYVSGDLNLFIPNFEEGSKAMLTVFDGQGKLIYSFIYDEYSFTQVVQNLAPGLYIIHVVYDHRLFSGKLIRK